MGGYIHREYLAHCEQPKEQGTCQYAWPSAIQDPTAAGTDGQSVHVMCHVGFERHTICFGGGEKELSMAGLDLWSQVCMCQVDCSVLALRVLCNYFRKFSSHQCHQESDLFIEYPQIHYIFRYIVR